MDVRFILYEKVETLHPVNIGIDVGNDVAFPRNDRLQKIYDIGIETYYNISGSLQKMVRGISWK